MQKLQVDLWGPQALRSIVKKIVKHINAITPQPDDETIFGEEYPDGIHLTADPSARGKATAFPFAPIVTSEAEGEATVYKIQIGPGDLSGFQFGTAEPVTHRNDKFTSSNGKKFWFESTFPSEGIRDFPVTTELKSGASWWTTFPATTKLDDEGLQSKLYLAICQVTAQPEDKAPVIKPILTTNMALSNALGDGKLLTVWVPSVGLPA